MNQKYDLHLSANRISRHTVKELEQLGFVRDDFANNTRCLPSEYHGTFRGVNQLPDDELWQKVCELLLADNTFSGCLEEESISHEHYRRIVGVGKEMPTALCPIPIVDVPDGHHKSCDIHTRINLEQSTPEAISQLEGLQIASFDRQTPEGLCRIYTVTCETREDGERMFDTLYRHFSIVPGLIGKIELEMATRFLRHPSDAATLPLTTTETVTKWLSCFHSQHS